VATGRSHRGGSISLSRGGQARSARSPSPRVRDRVAQTAAKLVLEPIFEASFLPSSFGFRPKRSAHQALEQIRKTANQGALWVVDLDFQDYYGSLDETYFWDSSAAGSAIVG